MFQGASRKKGVSFEDKDVDSSTERKSDIGDESEGEGCMLQWRLEENSGWYRRGM